MKTYIAHPSKKVWLKEILEQRGFIIRWKITEAFKVEKASIQNISVIIEQIQIM